MKIAVRFLALLFCLGIATTSFADDPSTKEQDQAGLVLAEKLRSMIPEKDSEIQAVLQIRSKKQKITNDIPLTCKVIAKGNTWETIYETVAVGDVGIEKLVVRHAIDQPNEYFYAKAKSSSETVPKLEALKPAEAAVPLAGSDFWLTDLGLDFLHWPVQRKLKGEMRLGQACDVLESSNLQGQGIVRIKSWIDQDTGGILIAEAFGADKKQVKEFSLSGSSFKKVNGQWQLEKMQISNLQTKSTTTLKFDLPKN